MTKNSFNYLNISVLTSHNSSNLNRDDANMQKTAYFGGVCRSRYSSQSFKYAIRNSEYYQSVFGKPSIRTTRLTDLCDHMVSTSSKKMDRDILLRTIAIMAGIDLTKPNAGKKKKPNEEDKDKIFSSAMTAWSREEIEEAYVIFESMAATGSDDQTIAKELKKKSLSFRKCLAHSVDIALSGRMITEGTMASVDGSMSLAHSFTTHEVESEIDWFTATDDVRKLINVKGSGHMNSFEFSSGVFYRYANLNLRQLQENLGGATREEALEIAKHVVYMMATVIPGAKQKSFAAYNMADLVLTSFSNAPCSLANAFEKPIRSESGFLQKSCKALLSYSQKISDAYDLNGPTMVFTTQDGIEAENTTHRIDDLTSWVSNDGRV